MTRRRETALGLALAVATGTAVAAALLFAARDAIPASRADGTCAAADCPVAP